MSRMSRAQVAVGLWRAQAKRWQAQATRLQADNTRLQARVAELEDKVERLTEQVARLGRVAFGGSSQKQAVEVAQVLEVGELADQVAERDQKRAQPSVSTSCETLALLE